ncbi:MAG: hypothetical protein MMC23_009466 [Stictis urceolatum]|nr:hypothetical protein [Stictis urceolata]
MSDSSSSKLPSAADLTLENSRLDRAISELQFAVDQLHYVKNENRLGELAKSELATRQAELSLSPEEADDKKPGQQSHPKAKQDSREHVLVLIDGHGFVVRSNNARLDTRLMGDSVIDRGYEGGKVAAEGISKVVQETMDKRRPDVNTQYTIFV